MTRIRAVFILLVVLYGLYVFASTLYALSGQTNASKSKKSHLTIQELSSYKYEGNLSALAIHTIWELPIHEPPKEIAIDTNESNESNETLGFELRNQNGFYTIIIDKKEFDFLGVAKQGGAMLGIFLSHKDKSKSKIEHFKEGETIHQKVKLHKIKHNILLLIDTKSYKKIEIPYFFVDELEFKPKENNVS
ncbi:MAG: hypothetical protein KU28_02985 [Sulfurovum sp. PC08-66]|nr:MAG: hypothetical protein KU28_02985 [Sulfurovum sp. PC08-66]